jgi:hypothetical protein
MCKAPLNIHDKGRDMSRSKRSSNVFGDFSNRMGRSHGMSNPQWCAVLRGCVGGVVQAIWSLFYDSIYPYLLFFANFIVNTGSRGARTPWMDDAMYGKLKVHQNETPYGGKLP